MKNILRVFDIFGRAQTCQDVLSEQLLIDIKNLIELLLVEIVIFLKYSATVSTSGKAK